MPRPPGGGGVGWKLEIFSRHWSWGGKNFNKKSGEEAKTPSTPQSTEASMFLCLLLIVCHLASLALAAKRKRHSGQPPAKQKHHQAEAQWRLWQRMPIYFRRLSAVDSSLDGCIPLSSMPQQVRSQPTAQRSTGFSRYSAALTTRSARSSERRRDRMPFSMGGFI